MHLTKQLLAADRPKSTKSGYHLLVARSPKHSIHSAPGFLHACIVQLLHQPNNPALLTINRLLITQQHSFIHANTQQLALVFQLAPEFV
jgi:hypothetical protein